MSDLPPRQLLAIGKRLRAGREHRKATIAEMCRWTNLSPADYKAAERGKAMLPPRSLWLFAVFCRGSVEWLLTGKTTERTVPSPLPELGYDLTGFADRIRQTRERLGLTLDDIDLGADATYIPLSRWQQWEAGYDEPEYGFLPDIADHFEVDLGWLYSDQPAKQKSSAKASRNLPTLDKLDDTLWLPGSHPGRGRRLIQAREAAGLSLADVCRITGWSGQCMKLFESEKAPLADSGDGDRPTILGTLYGVDPTWLLYGDDGLAVLKRRLERFKSRLGTRPGKRKAA